MNMLETQECLPNCSFILFYQEHQLNAIFAQLKSVRSNEFAGETYIHTRFIVLYITVYSSLSCLL